MFKKLWKIILVIIIIVIAIYFPQILLNLGTWLTSTGALLSGSMITALAATVPWWVGAVVGIGAAYLLDPDTTSEIIGDIADVAGDVGGAVGSVVGDTVGGLLEGLWPAILIGGAAWFFLTSDSKKEKEQPAKGNVESDAPRAAR